jgi:hypothetical protein
MPSGVTVARKMTGNPAQVHGLMVERFDLDVERRVDCRLQNGGAVEGDGEIA